MISFSNTTSSFVTTFSGLTLNSALSSQSSDARREFTVVSKPVGFIIGEQLRMLWDLFYSNIPSFLPPSVGAHSVESCSESPESYSCQNANPCSKPVGSYLTSCRNQEVTYISHEKTCRLTADCDTMFEGMPTKPNELKYNPNKIVVLGNNNGTFTIEDLIEKRTTPEAANTKLKQQAEVIKEIDHQLANSDLEASEKTKLLLEKGDLIQKEEETIGSLSAGDIITVDAEGMPLVITKQNKVASFSPYSFDTIDSFKRLASGTGGILGLSPSPDSLTIVIEKIFSHILQAAKRYEALDIAFLLDTTVSMSDDMEQIKVNLSAFLKRLQNSKREVNNNLRIALMEYKDNTLEDPFLNRVNTDFTKDLDKVSGELNKVKVEGGGDDPEAVYDALVAAEDLSWNPKAMRVVILIGDAPPHPRTIDQRYDEKEVIERYKNSDINLVIYPIVTNR